jgi:transcriptional regulator of acetoin/glycerol metabolism
VITPADMPPDLSPSDTPKMHYKRKRRLKITDSRVDEALEMAQGNRQEAAKILGVSRSTLYRFFERQ